MSVNVVLPGVLRELAGGRSSVSLDGQPATVGEALEALRTTCPGVHRSILTEAGEVRPHVNVFVGDTEIRRAAGLATPLDDGDEIVVLPAVSGG